jgi:hypothetical protein
MTDTRTVKLSNGNEVSVQTLHIYFNMVANKDNWKNPIDARLALSSRGRMLVKEAVVFFTGSVPTFKKIGMGYIEPVYHVRAAGYYLTIGA